MEPGHSIGKVSIVNAAIVNAATVNAATVNVATDSSLIVVELNDGALGKANLFDLVGQTLRFTPDGSQYRVDHGALNWDSDFGSQLTGAEVTLHQFAFPFSGKKWDSFFIGRGILPSPSETSRTSLGSKRSTGFR